MVRFELDDKISALFPDLIYDLFLEGHYIDSDDAAGDFYFISLFFSSHTSVARVIPVLSE